MEDWLRHTLLARSVPFDGKVRTLLRRVAGQRDDIRFRRAASLVLHPYGNGLTVHNFVTRRAFVCDSKETQVLLSAGEWRTAAYFGADESIVDVLARLVELNALVIEGTRVAAKDAEYRSRWKWGPVAGLYHFAVRDAAYLADDGQIEPRPTLFRQHANGIELPAVDENDDLWQALRCRRTGRDFADRRISRESLAAVLLGGFGVTGFVNDVTRGRMPLTMSPSGGALNPFEGYVLVRAVEELPPGIYHYSGFDHTLQLVRDTAIPSAGTLFAGQAWADAAAAVLFLVANFARTMWKYRSPVSYRVVMIEAGHIGQNIQLVATQQHLVTAPTCALRESMIEELLGVDAVDEAVVYAIALGVATSP
jgi:SagB-type dehydrogenase family enzyme